MTCSAQVKAWIKTGVGLVIGGGSGYLFQYLQSAGDPDNVRVHKALVWAGYGAALAVAGHFTAPANAVGPVPRIPMFRKHCIK